MATFRLTAVAEDGYGLTYHWGDAYEVEAEDYEAAEADVLGREGVSPNPYDEGPHPYDRIVKAWVKDDDGIWQEIELEGGGI